MCASPARGSVPKSSLERPIRMTISIAEVRALVPFEEVYRCHAGSVHRFCLSQVCDQAVAEDLTHETFVRAFVAYERVRPDLDAARAWLLAIARNLCTDHHRRRGRWRRLRARRRGPTSRPSPSARSTSRA